MDEARNDQVYELEIAFQQIPDHGATPPWMVDRIFRNLLVDATGNTHRAEFCIDKLYSPDSASGRLGLLEMRAFEMPPHSRMSLTQHLLLRALIAHFWEKPYRHELVRWRTEIHDRFMLPYFVHQDLEDVVADLNDGGYPLRREWFAPHFEFRFPLYGTIEQRGIELELRQAIEPWHVLGEEASAGGTVALRRFFAGTTAGAGERHGRSAPRGHLQRRARAAASDRHERSNLWPACATAPGSRPIACIRRSESHAPLVFDVVDTWSRRSIGGCTYHVAHPGGRSYDRFSGECVRSGRPPHRAIFQVRAHAGPDGRR